MKKKPWLKDAHDEDPWETDNFVELTVEQIRELETSDMLFYAQRLLQHRSINTHAVNGGTLTLRSTK